MVRNRRRRRERIFHTWKYSVYRVLEKVIYQEKDICWAVSLIRQLSAQLKLRGVIHPKSSLSIQELVIYVYKTYLDENFAIDKLDSAETALIQYGTVDEKWCPLTYLFNKIKFFEDDVPRYKIRGMVVHYLNDFPTSYAFESAIVYALSHSPIAASIYMCESYNNIRGKSVYSPVTTNEVCTMYHTMILCAHGIDKHGRSFWEFQDSYGKKWGYKGYIRVAKGMNLIVNFVQFVFF